MTFYDDRKPNMHIDFKVHPWSWCSKHERPEHVDWAGIGCDRSGFYRTQDGAAADYGYIWVNPATDVLYTITWAGKCSNCNVLTEASAIEAPQLRDEFLGRKREMPCGMCGENYEATVVGLTLAP